MDNRFKIIKTKCSVCGKVEKIIVTKDTKRDTVNFYYRKDEPICKQCESTFHLLEDYSCRGYGYKFSTRTRKTVMDTFRTPTYGVEIEVAGNIKSIEKISKMTSYSGECSIGYDTSVEGAEFELSYAPGTYYWYLYESKLKSICDLLEKDPWTLKNNPTIGLHIHIGNIDAKEKFKKIVRSRNNDIYFWTIMRAAAERDFNEYCMPQFGSNRHNAISYSTRWGTIEFRIFSGTYNFKTIMERIKFVRQVIDNATDSGIEWWNFSKEVKEWILNKLENCPSVDDTRYGKIKDIFDGNTSLIPEDSYNRTSLSKISDFLDGYEEDDDNDNFYDDDYDEDRESDEEMEENW